MGPFRRARAVQQTEFGLPLSDSEPEQPGTIASVRNAFEHGQNLAIRGGLGLASGPDGWWISYRDRMFQTKDLLAAAEDLHHAIRAAVDPEVFSDFHGDHPFIELRDPADIVRPWRPGLDITARQAATMAHIQAGLHGGARSAQSTPNDEVALPVEERPHC
jgi:hypothetical protein